MEELEAMGCGQIVRHWEYEKVNAIYCKYFDDEYDGGIYIMKEEVEYIIRKYEILKDSFGNNHRVQISYTNGHRLISDKNCFKVIDNKITNDNLIHTFQYTYQPYQIHLLKYLFISLESRKIAGYDIKLYLNKKNKWPEFYYKNIPGYIIEEAFELSGYYPFFERCNHRDINYIPDRYFFNFPNREKAIERCNISCCYIGGIIKNPTFDNIDYVNMTDIELVKFMNDRFKKRIKFENLLKN